MSCRWRQSRTRNASPAMTMMARAARFSINMPAIARHLGPTNSIAVKQDRIAQLKANINRHILLYNIMLYIMSCIITNISLNPNGNDMLFTWFSRKYGFSPTRHQILPSPPRGSEQDTVSSWEKTPSLLENHVKCIFSHSTLCSMGETLCW